MNEGTNEYETEDLSVKHALAQGIHDGVSETIKYGVTAAVALMVAYAILDRSTRKRIRSKFL